MLKTKKTALRWTGMQQRHNHAGHLIGVAELVDQNGITLPGITLQIEVKAPIDSARCLFLFSIMQLRNRKRSRLYQLEVAPSSKRTHNGLLPLYGPHEHIGEEQPTSVADDGVKCDNWTGSLQWFFTRAGIDHFDIQDPNHVEL